MARPRVLQIGIDPAVVDFSPWPGQDADGLLARLNDAGTVLRNAGFDVTVCLLPDDEAAAESVVREVCIDGSFDVVEIGSGLSEYSSSWSPPLVRVSATSVVRDSRA